MNLRPFQPNDLPRVVEVFTDSVRTLAAPYYTPEQLTVWAPIPADLDRWRVRLAALHTRVAEVEGEVAGFASFTEAGYLDFLFTHPAFARCGVASGLYRDVEEWLRVAGVRTVTAHVSLAARPFFDRQGFQVDTEECVECRGAFLRRFAMHKPLPDPQAAASRSPDYLRARDVTV